VWDAHRAALNCASLLPWLSIADVESFVINNAIICEIGQLEEENSSYESSDLTSDDGEVGVLIADEVHLLRRQTKRCNSSAEDDTKGWGGVVQGCI
jgi:hypothetical protein